jgi:hypothetical protein
MTEPRRWTKYSGLLQRYLQVGKEDAMSWNKTRFSQWEVEGEVRQRVNRALAEADQERAANQCQVAKERSAIVRAICWLADRVRVEQEAIQVWMRVPKGLEKGAKQAKETG